MNRIKIITDCTSDLTNSLYKKYDIEVLPLYVTIGGKTYADKQEINSEEMFKKVQEYNELPKTSTISPAVLMECFETYLKQGYDILFIGLGSSFSGVFNNANLVAKEYEQGRIRIVDSKNLSSGIGLLLLKAAKLKEKGLGLEEIAQEIEKIVPNVRSMFSINTLEYLHKGGRCSGTTRLFGTLLKIKPIIRVIDGKMEVAKKPHGKFQVSLDAQLEYLEHDKEIIDPEFIMVTHCLASEDAKYLMSKISGIVKADNIIETEASSVISTHCGPRTIGILYIVKE